MDYYYVIAPFEDKFTPLKKYVFGPYKDYDKALEVSDKVGGWDIVSLPYSDIEDVVDLLNRNARG